MLTGLVHMSIALHGIATAFFLVYPLRFRPEMLQIARRILWVAVLSQGGVIAIVTMGGSPADEGLPDMQLFSLAFAIAFAYLLSTLWRQISLLGTFLVPVSAAILLALLFAPVAGKPTDAPSIIGVVKFLF